MQHSKVGKTNGLKKRECKQMPKLKALKLETLMGHYKVHVYLRANLFIAFLSFLNKCSSLFIDAHLHSLHYDVEAFLKAPLGLFSTLSYV